MIITKTSKIKWNPRNKKRFVELGYEYTSMGEEFDVDVKHLSPYSKAVVEVQCDYCEQAYTTTNEKLAKILNNSSLVKKDACEDCVQEKIKEVNQIKYGVDYAISSDAVRKKSRDTCMKNYGVENPFESQEIVKKIKKTSLERYGVESYTQTDEYVEKSQKTSLKRYGKTHHTKTDEYRERYSGKGNPCWKGGVKNHRTERATIEYREWRKSVFDRDMYTCQCCKVKGSVTLNAHHIHNWNDYPSLRYENANGITLCQKCHLGFHSEYGKSHNNLKQLNAFLNDSDASSYIYHG